MQEKKSKIKNLNKKRGVRVNAKKFDSLQMMEIREGLEKGIGCKLVC